MEQQDERFMLYRPKSDIVKACVWNKNGDHPYDDNSIVNPRFPHEAGAPAFIEGEGKIVRYYRNPEVSGGTVCPQCGATYHVHGWIDKGSYGHKVCPGSVIIESPVGWIPISREKLAELYEPYEDKPLSYVEAKIEL